MSFLDLKNVSASNLNILMKKILHYNRV